MEAWKPDAKQIQLTDEKLKGQISKNRDDAMGRLLNTKRQLQTETDDGIRKLLWKYEKKLFELNWLKNFYQIRQQEYKELQDLVNKYEINEVTPLQVAGDDTIPGNYDFERDALYYIRTIYNAD